MHYISLFIMFVQILNYIDFDLSEPKGNIVLKLNGKEAAYTDMVNNGDIIYIYWKNKKKGLKGYE